MRSSYRNPLLALALLALPACAPRPPAGDAGTDATLSDGAVDTPTPPTDCSLRGCLNGELFVQDAMGNPLAEFSGTFTNGPNSNPFSCTPSSVPTSSLTAFSCLGGGRVRLSADATVSPHLRVTAGAAGSWEGETSEAGMLTYANGPGCGPACNTALTVIVRP